MEVQKRNKTIEERLEEGIAKYSTKVASQLSMEEKKHLELYKKLQQNRYQVFEVSDEKNRTYNLHFGRDKDSIDRILEFALIDYTAFERSLFFQRKRTRKEFVSAIKNMLYGDAIEEDKSAELIYLLEDRRTPYDSSSGLGILHYLGNFIFGGKK